MQTRKRLRVSGSCTRSILCPGGVRSLSAFCRLPRVPFSDAASSPSTPRARCCGWSMLVLGFSSWPFYTHQSVPALADATVDRSLSQAIQQARLAKKITQKDLAQLIAVQPSIVRRALRFRLESVSLTLCVYTLFTFLDRRVRERASDTQRAVHCQARARAYVPNMCSFPTIRLRETSSPSPPLQLEQSCQGRPRSSSLELLHTRDTPCGS